MTSGRIGRYRGHHRVGRARSGYARTGPLVLVGLLALGGAAVRGDAVVRGSGEAPRRTAPAADRPATAKVPTTSAAPAASAAPAVPAVPAVPARMGAGPAGSGTTPSAPAGNDAVRSRPAAPPLPCPAVAPGYLTTTPPTRPRTVALTFDDGPGPWTPAFLALLARYRVNGTFFMVGERAQAHPGLVTQVVAGGNLVGNHSLTHPLHPGLSGLPPQETVRQIGDAQSILARLSGSPPCFFRAPGESHRTARVQAIAHRYGLTVTDTTRTARDSVSPRNVRWDPAWRDLIVARLTGAGDHPIVLMHDGHGDNKVNELSALERIIVWYRSRGYVFTDPAGRPFPG